ncbi:MAG TPA: hypothetical protein VD968_13150 [Pyrinomonadaceae bacterium]|nr:hypothetical protein [Pyrinomonadaceae bacterium]
MCGAESGRFGADKEVEELVRGFESGGLKPDDFSHRGHLAVALWYQLRHPYEEALAVTRRNILAFIARHGVDPKVYSETVTVFWMRRARAFLESRGAARPVHELANALADECGDSRLINEYFSKELLDTDGARRGWLEPDLKPLDF